MSDYMPDDVLTKVLAYLPPKSLVRFTCVSKSWHSLITSSDFITAHLNRTRLSNNKNNNHLFFLRYRTRARKKEQHSLRIDNLTFDEYDAMEFPIKSRCPVSCCFYILGSCNGLICLWEGNTHDFPTLVLWNPSIRKYLTLPLPDFLFLTTRGPFKHAIGFGFDSRTNDYKVVRVVYLEEEKGHSPIVQRYKLSTGYWETITSTIDPSCSLKFRFATQAFTNGAFHWPAFKSYPISLIMSFNMSDEVFLEIGLPNGVVRDCWDVMDIAVCREWLSFFSSPISNPFYRNCSVWVMKEYGVVESWTKLYTFDLNGGLHASLGFRRSGEILVAMKRNMGLASYDPETQEIKYVDICDFVTNSLANHFHGDAYVESLVLLGMHADGERGCDASVEEK